MNRVLSVFAAVALVAGCATTALGHGLDRHHSSERPGTDGDGRHAAGPRGRLGGRSAVISGLERLHPDPYHSTPKAGLVDAIGALKATIPGVLTTS